MLRVFLMALVLLVASPALAAEFVWATQASDATRFVEKDSKSVGSTTVDQKLEVLAREGERVRVRIGAGFGWVDASTVTTTNPAGDTDETYEE